MVPVRTGAGAEAGIASVADSFRVRVRLERFFSDERARVLLCVSPRRRVRWLARRLRVRFALPSVVLLCAGHLLPPWESLAVLERDDTVDVLPAAPDCDVGESDSVTRPLDGADAAADMSPAAQDVREVFNTPHIDVTDTGAVSAAPATELHEPDELQEHKRRALLQLEALLHGEEGAPAEGAARPRRRRVRRRRRARSPAPSVLHNGCPRSLAPRVVRSLDEEASS